MFGGNEVQQGLQLLRITVLGSANSGKTSLISSFVNNFCPTMYSPTTVLDTLLYYKTIDLVEVKCQQIPGEPHSLQEQASGAEIVATCMLCAKVLQPRERFWRCKQKVSCGNMCSKCWLEQHEEQTFPVLVEVEDSFGSKAMTGDRYETMFLMESRRRDRSASNVGVSESTPPRPTSPAGPDSATRLRPTDFVRQNSPNALIPPTEGFEDRSSPFIMDFNSLEESQPQAQVLRRFNPPVVAMHTPLSKRRMGYLIVYDCQDDQSYDEAIELLKRILQLCKKKQPVIFLVANKLDTASGTKHIQMRSSAKQFVEKTSMLSRKQSGEVIRYQEVSATDMKKVRSLFRRMLLAVKDSSAFAGSLGGGDSGNIFSAFNPFGDSKESSARSSSKGGSSRLGGPDPLQSPRSADEDSSDSDSPQQGKKEKCAVQ